MEYRVREWKVESLLNAGTILVRIPGPFFPRTRSRQHLRQPREFYRGGLRRRCVVLLCASLKFADCARNKDRECSLCIRVRLEEDGAWVLNGDETKTEHTEKSLRVKRATRANSKRLPPSQSLSLDNVYGIVRVIVK